MPNHVQNIIRLDCTKSQFDGLISTIGTKERPVDFRTLIPVPLHIYQGDLCKNDDDDFKSNTWGVWNRENWGTKWNAYDGATAYENNQGVLRFQTAWATPYPFVIALINKFNIPFTYYYFDEGECFWGVEQWSDQKRQKRSRKESHNKEDIYKIVYDEEYRNSNED